VAAAGVLLLQMPPVSPLLLSWVVALAQTVVVPVMVPALQAVHTPGVLNVAVGSLVVSAVLVLMVTDLASATVPLRLMGSEPIAKFGMVTPSAASGTPADQLAELTQLVLLASGQVLRACSHCPPQKSSIKNKLIPDTDREAVENWCTLYGFGKFILTYIVCLKYAIKWVVELSSCPRVNTHQRI
jgi:hypothetical protein